MAKDSPIQFKGTTLKIIQTQRLDETSRRWFVREARAAAALSHPFICAVHEVLEHEGQPVIVMEYVHGETVLQRTASGALAADDVVRYGREMAEALAAAHARGIVHRDVSAANVMITADGHVKLMDFGLARGENNRLTATGVFMGTPSFTAPELPMGTEPTVATVSSAQVRPRQAETSSKAASASPPARTNSVIAATSTTSLRMKWATS